MASQNDVLRVLAEGHGSLNISGICRSLNLDAYNHVIRKGIIKACGTLIERGLIFRAWPAKTEPRRFEPPTVLFQATEKGIAFSRAKTPIASGPRGRHSGPFSEGRNTLRAKLWQTLRLQQKATVPELLEVCLVKGGDAASAADNAHKYFKALARASIVRVLNLRAKGFAPSSNGFKRYALLVDLGPLAPQICKCWVFDRNKRERIPYGAKSQQEAA